MKHIEDTLDEDLQEIQKLVAKKIRRGLEDDEIEFRDLGSVLGFLKNNKMVQDKKVHSEADLIDELIDD